MKTESHQALQVLIKAKLGALYSDLAFAKASQNDWYTRADPSHPEGNVAFTMLSRYRNRVRRLKSKIKKWEQTHKDLNESLHKSHSDDILKASLENAQAALLSAAETVTSLISKGSK